jgi:hypothetical protein
VPGFTNGRDLRTTGLAVVILVGTGLLAARVINIYPDPAAIGGMPSAILATVAVFLLPLLSTLLIEVPIVAAADGFTRRGVAAGVLVNTLTNPLATAVLLWLTWGAYSPWFRWGAPAYDFLGRFAPVPDQDGLMLDVQVVAAPRC